MNLPESPSPLDPAADRRSLITDAQSLKFSKAQWLRGGFGAVIGLAVLLWVVSKFDIENLAASVSKASTPKVAAASVLFILGMAARGVRISWIGHGHWRQWMGCAKGVIFGLGINSFIPLRIGEVVKAIIVSRRGGMDLIQAGTAVVVERFLDVSFFGISIASAFALNARMFSDWLKTARKSAGVANATGSPNLQTWFWAAAAAAASSGLLLSRRLRAALVRGAAAVYRRLAEFWPSLAGRLGMLYFWTALIWTLDALFLLSMAGAFGLSIKPAHLIFLQMVLTAAYASSVSPGALGLYEAMGLWTLKEMGYPAPISAAFLLAAHGLIYLLLIALFAVAAAAEAAVFQSQRPSTADGRANKKG